MDKKAIKSEFWVSPRYHFSSEAHPTTDKTAFAKVSDGKDGNDYRFLLSLEECTLPSGSERMVFDGKVYCQIRTGITKTNMGETVENIVKGFYGRSVRIDTMPPADIPEVLKEILTRAGYEPASPSNNIILQGSGLLDKF